MEQHDEDGLSGMLSDQDKKVSEAKGVLSQLFRKVLADLNVTPAKWNSLMNSYLDNPRNRVPKHSRGRSSTRGNLNKELRKTKMTWSNFEKGVRFLNPIEATFTIRLRWRGGKNTVHEIKLLGDGNSISADEEEKDEDK